MILVDTNVIVDLWKNASDEEINTFYDSDVVICGVVKSELASWGIFRKESESDCI